MNLLPSLRHTPSFLALTLSLLGAACGGTVREAHSDPFSDLDAGSGTGGGGTTSSSGSGSSSGGTTGSSSGSNSGSSSGSQTEDSGIISCVDLPALTADDLTCDVDSDCVTTWTGTVCACGCYCSTVFSNAAAAARAALLLHTLSSDTSCTEPPCGCPALAVPRCIAHQCVACGNPVFAPLPNQPAACTPDAGGDDAG
jgi:hypothetical protein